MVDIIRFLWDNSSPKGLSPVILDVFDVNESMFFKFDPLLGLLNHVSDNYLHQMDRLTNLTRFLECVGELIYGHFKIVLDRLIYTLPYEVQNSRIYLILSHLLLAHLILLLGLKVGMVL